MSTDGVDEVCGYGARSLTASEHHTHGSRNGLHAFLARHARAPLLPFHTPRTGGVRGGL